MSRACVSGVHLVGVHVTGVHLMDVHLIGVYLMCYAQQTDMHILVMKALLVL
jgi:hypothetical protein